MHYWFLFIGAGAPPRNMYVTVWKASIAQARID